jgi:hypothetical protein
MELFDILKAFFNDKKWEEVSNHDKARNYFMINRLMSIASPLHANAFNHTKIDPVSVVNYWKETLNKKYSSAPGWFFTPSNKKDKSKKYSPNESVQDFILNKYEISSREIKELGDYFPKEFKKFCDTIEEMIS